MKAPTECGLIAVKLSLHLCDRSPRLSDPSEQRHCRGNSTARPGSPGTPPSTSDHIEGIFGQPRDGNPDRWIRISLTKAGAPINEGSASAGACCAGGGAAEPLVLLQRGAEMPFCQLSLPCCSAKQRAGSPRTSGEAGWAGSRTELLNYFAVVTIVLFFNSSGLRAAIYLLFGVILFVLQ